MICINFSRWVPLTAAAVLLVVIAGPASADGIHAQRERAEASMLVTGEVFVTPTGTVSRFKLDEPEELPEPVKTLIAKAMPLWRFEPVRLDGNAVNAKARMNLRVVARHSGKASDSFTITIQSAYFGDGKSVQGVEKHVLKKPRFPQMALNARVGGTVYLLAELSADGKVEKIAAEQVNLTAVGSETEVKRLREALVKASVDAVKEWTFNSSSLKPHQYVRVPIRFNINGPNQPKRGYGHWDIYIPGPRQFLPWADHAQLASGGVDALPPGTAVPAEQALTLRTPLGGAS